MGVSNKPIAIKFGAPSKPKPSAPASALGKRPRAGASAFGGDSDSEDDSHQHGKKEEITGFSVDGQELSEKKRREEEEKNKKQYVIQRMSNKDWRAEARAKRDPTASNNKNDQRTATTTETVQEPTIKWGLSVKDKNESISDDAQTQEAAEPDKEQEKPKSADQEAIDALEGKTQSKQLVIAALTEDEAYQRDASEAGATSTLEDYEAMPVEEFGAALLRGMGWDGKSSGKQREVKRRPNRLGLGAKELDGAEDLGAWGQPKKKVRLADYRREQDKKRSESGGGRDSYKKEKERERERDRDRYDGSSRRSDDRRDDRRRDDRRGDDRRDDRRDDDRRRHDDRRR